MSGHDPVHVLMAEDDPGDALMVRESFAQAGKNSRSTWFPTASARCGSCAGTASTPPRPGPG